MELDRSGRSYTIDTLEALGDEQDLIFICGADAFRHPWHRPQDVLERLQTLLLANRHGYENDLPPLLADMPARLQAKIRRLSFPDIAISSSDIRARIALGRPFRYLIPDVVYQLIRQKGLYTDKEKA